jgi:hypothetical protein
MKELMFAFEVLHRLCQPKSISFVTAAGGFIGVGFGAGSAGLPDGENFHFDISSVRLLQLKNFIVFFYIVFS